MGKMLSMLTTQLQTISCPYCGEFIEIIIDGSIESQQYTEDCSVCCQPIVMDIKVNYDDTVEVIVKSEQDC